MSTKSTFLDGHYLDERSAYFLWTFEPAGVSSIV